MFKLLFYKLRLDIHSFWERERQNITITNNNSKTFYFCNFPNCPNNQNAPTWATRIFLSQRKDEVGRILCCPALRVCMCIIFLIHIQLPSSTPLLSLSLSNFTITFPFLFHISYSHEHWNYHNKNDKMPPLCLIISQVVPRVFTVYPT